MKRHKFDPLSFVFGVILILIAAAAVWDQSLRWDLNAWVVPAAVLVLGIGLLASALRSNSPEVVVDAEAISTGAADDPTEHMD